MIAMRPIREYDVIDLLNNGRFEGEVEGYVVMDGPKYLGHMLYRVDGAVTQVLECGVEENRVEAFGQRFEEDFGPEAALPPKNLVDTKHLELRCPDVTIQVNPERGDLVETRIIDGVRYILIRAEEGVEVNGVEVKIGE